MPYDSEATKTRILTAAVGEFAEHGLAGARVDRIASRAQANKQAIYAYFGNKERLFDTVLRQQKSELIDAVPIDAADMPGYVSRLFEYHLHHPEVVRLMLWEALERGTLPASEEEERIERYGDKVQTVESGQQRGTIRTDIDPAALTLLLLGVACWPHAVPQVRRMLLRDDTGHERLRAAVVTAAAALTRLPQDQDDEGRA